MAQKQLGLHLPIFKGGSKNRFLIKWQLLQIVREVIERLDNVKDAEALYSEVQRAFAHSIINKEEFTELTDKLDLVLAELKKGE